LALKLGSGAPNPDAAVEVGDREVRVRSEGADFRLWQKIVEMYPTYDYQTKTKREIPLLVLHPMEGAS
jgi:hypothetical protein